MDESKIIGSVFLIFGLLNLVRPDLLLSFQAWFQRVVMGAKYEPGPRTFMLARIIGASFLVIGFVVISGIFDYRDPSFEGKYWNDADMERIREDIAKEDCRVLEGIWENGECVIPADILTRNNEAKNKCLESGGKWGRFGLSVKEQCNLLTSDGGKACTDSSQCEGACFGEGAGATSGKCSEWTINKGCHAIVTDGLAPGIICED